MRLDFVRSFHLLTLFCAGAIDLLIAQVGHERADRSLRWSSAWIRGTPQRSGLRTRVEGLGAGSRSAVADTLNRAARRAVDLTGGLVLLVLSAPLLTAAALAVFLGSGRPVFFGHHRVGQGGKPFRCWKLRTMGVDAERALDRDASLRERHLRNGFKLPADDDPRVTQVGRWLRRTYLDELPQLFNVLNGTMSLVGPRPVVQEELVHFGAAVDELLAEKPGIFGEWTSRGRGRPDYPGRAHVELDYVRDRSFRRDLAILVRSVPVVLRGHE
ncbi:MAG: sugar transferase [Gemmatimonadetes bacterium]|nr:sugar transferase [Gemmatimonadota bacterium]